MTVIVEDTPPAFGDLGTVTGFEGFPISHTGGSISFATVDNPPLSLSVDYGDGTPLENISLVNSGDPHTTVDFTLDHTYETGGDYTIALTADDGDGPLVTGQIDLVIDIVYDPSNQP